MTLSTAHEVVFGLHTLITAVYNKSPASPVGEHGKQLGSGIMVHTQCVSEREHEPAGVESYVYLSPDKGESTRPVIAFHYRHTNHTELTHLHDGAWLDKLVESAAVFDVP